MSLAQKLAIRIALLVLGLVLLGGGSLAGLVKLKSSFDTAELQYDRLRHVYEAGDRVAIARALLRTDHPDRLAIYEQLEAALQSVNAEQGEPDRAIDANLRAAQRIIRAGEPLDQAAARLNAALSEVARAADRAKQQILHNRARATARLIRTIEVIATLTLGLIAAAVMLGIRQHRSVMGPLRRIEDAVRKIAGGQFDVRVPEIGDREFAQLAQRFNRTVEQLEQLYRDLEQQVSRKSAQLVQSERLAGVGYLAAGVAHEINNPLGIIAGYAEAAMRKLDAKPDDPAARRARESLAVICEQAFRCKQITQKLLAMARPGEANRVPVSLAQVAGHVTQIVAGLPQLEGRRVEFSARAGDEMTVLGVEGELTQVLLNLLTNAVEMVEPGAGRIGVTAQRQGSWAVVRVTDNGRGMTPEAMARAFEPFFSDKPRRGTGLGLAIAHAIVQQHGGRLAGSSDGPGRGSTFTLELPAIDAAAAGAGGAAERKGAAS